MTTAKASLPTLQNPQSSHLSLEDRLPEEDRKREEEKKRDLNPNEGPGSGPHLSATYLAQAETKTDAALQKEIRSYNRKADALLRRGQAFLEKAIDEDWGPGGWEPDQFAGIFHSAQASLQARATTLPKAKARLAAVEEMMHQIVATETGALACFDLGDCNREILQQVEKRTEVYRNYTTYPAGHRADAETTQVCTSTAVTSTTVYYFQNKAVYQTPVRKNKVAHSPQCHASADSRTLFGN